MDQGYEGAWPSPTLPPPTPPPPPSPDRRRLSAPGWLMVAVVSALIGGGVGAAIAVAAGRSTTPSTVKEVAPGPALAGGASIPSIVQKILPEVVTIDATGPATSILGQGGTEEDQGTGMIVSSAGEILTNNHVVAGATTITVTLYHQTTALPATLVGADPGSDVALLKITKPPPNLQSVSFGDSTQLQVGDAVIAVGNALGLSAGTPTVTSGIVSATGRTEAAGDAGGGTTETLSNLIQTDAAINSGNSGGPLVDSAGQVVAMNTAVASSSSGNAPAQNIGFAIPSSTIEALLSTLRAGGTAAAAGGYLGVEVADMTAQIQQEYGLVPSSGALVDGIVPGSPASAAGLQVGDVIVDFNGQAVNSAQNLVTDVQKAPPGTAVKLTVWRGTQKLTVAVTLGQEPAS